MAILAGRKMAGPSTVGWGFLVRTELGIDDLSEQDALPLRSLDEHVRGRRITEALQDFVTRRTMVAKLVRNDGLKSWRPCFSSDGLARGPRDCEAPLRP